VTAGNIDIVSYLVNAGSDLNTFNVQGGHVIKLAARCAKKDIVHLLLKTEVESNQTKIGTRRADIVKGDVKATAL
jgi:ankyrin repeat protein